MLKFLFGRKNDEAQEPPANTSPVVIEKNQKDEPLLSELEDLQEALHATSAQSRRQPDTSAIPILDDIVESGVGEIDEVPEETDAPEKLSRRGIYADFEHELLIQEVIDDLMPAIESELRKRLLKLDSAILSQWHRERAEPDA